MPRFTLRDVFVTMTALAPGMVGIATLLQMDMTAYTAPTRAACILIASSCAIGVGIAAPFHRKAIGVIIGTAIGIVLAFFLIIFIEGMRSLNGV